MAFENLKFTKEHEWVKLEGENGKVGVSDYAQHELGDVVYVELPKIGKAVKKADPCANIESVKAVSDVYSPLSGTVIQVNEKLGSNPELINQDPYGEGWLFVIKLENNQGMQDLMDHAKYQEYLKGISGEY